MGWTLETYDKAPAFGSPSNISVCMFEILRGIKQRRELIGLEPGSWLHRGDGTFGAVESAADLKDLPIAFRHPSPSARGVVEQNMDILRIAILALIDSGKFMKASGKSEALDRDWVSDQIGRDIAEYPDINPGASTVTLNAAYWQGLQDALDLLIYIKVSVNAVFNETTCPDLSRHDRVSDFQDTVEEAWDAMTGDTAEPKYPWTQSIWASDLLLLVTRWYAYDSGDWCSAFSADFTSFVITLPPQRGALTHACYRGGYRAVHHSLDELAIRIGDATQTLDLTVSFPPFAGLDFTTGHFDPGVSATDPVDLIFDTEITTPFPATCPFAPPGYLNPGQVYFSVGGVDMYFDLSGELEDQS